MLIQLSHIYSNLAEVVKEKPKLQTQYDGLMKLKTEAEKLAEQKLYENI